MSGKKVFLSGLDKVADTLLKQVVVKTVDLLMLCIVRATLTNDGNVLIFFIDFLKDVIVEDIEGIAFASLSDSYDVVSASGIGGSLSGFFG